MALKSKRSMNSAGIKHGEVWGIVLIGLSIILFVSFYFYNPSNNPLLGTDAGAAKGPDRRGGVLKG